MVSSWLSQWGKGSISPWWTHSSQGMATCWVLFWCFQLCCQIYCGLHAPCLAWVSPVSNTLGGKCSRIVSILLHLHFQLTGATLTVILDLPFGYSVWISAVVAIIYTLMGGLYSVAYTDVIQLALVFFSLVSYRVFQDVQYLKISAFKDSFWWPVDLLAVVVCPIPDDQQNICKHHWDRFQKRVSRTVDRHSE